MRRARACLVVGALLLLRGWMVWRDVRRESPSLRALSGLRVEPVLIPSTFPPLNGLDESVFDVAPDGTLLFRRDDELINCRPGDRAMAVLARVPGLETFALDGGGALLTIADGVLSPFDPDTGGAEASSSPLTRPRRMPAALLALQFVPRGGAVGPRLGPGIGGPPGVSPQLGGGVGTIPGVGGSTGGINLNPTLQGFPQVNPDGSGGAGGSSASEGAGGSAPTSDQPVEQPAEAQQEPVNSSPVVEHPPATERDRKAVPAGKRRWLPEWIAPPPPEEEVFGGWPAVVPGEDAGPLRLRVAATGPVRPGLILPSRGMLLSKTGRPDEILLFGGSTPGVARDLYRLETDGTADWVARAPGPIILAAEARRHIYFAVPLGESSPGRAPAEWALAHLIPEIRTPQLVFRSRAGGGPGRLQSLVADPSGRAVFFSTPGKVFACHGPLLVKLLDGLGGVLRVRDDFLYVYNARRKTVVRIRGAFIPA